MPGDRATTAAGRSVLLLLLLWWTLSLVPRPLDADRIMASFLHLIHLPFHEAGHVLFSPFGSFLMVLGGSLLQVLVPLVCAVSFIRRAQWFAAAVCVWWMGTSLVDLGPYIADARALQLPLLGGATGAEVEGHDWEAILTQTGTLHLDRPLGLIAHVGGSALMLAGLVAAGYLTAREASFSLTADQQ